MDERPRPPHERLSEVPPPAGEDPPFRGEHAAPRDGGGIEHQCLEFCPICRTADVMRAALPPEAREHWLALQREGLLAARAMLDHYLRHLDAQPSGGGAPVEDIPIE
jgi:hypothetical protein